MKTVLIVKTGCTIPQIPRDAGDFEDWIRQGMELEPARVRVAKVFDGEPLPPPEELSAVVITGSPAMVSEREAWSEATAAWLRELPASLPVLGICYGHQLLAHALGGEVGYHPRGREIGTVAIRLTAAATRDPLFCELPGAFTAHATHSQSVLTPPPDSEVLAANDFDGYHGLRFRERVWGVQFHPEFDAFVMRSYLEARSDVLRQEGLDPEALRLAVQPTPQAQGLLRRFAALADMGRC